MSYLCPNCQLPLHGENPLTCAHGHSFGYEDGVLVLLSEAFGARLRAFLTAFTPLRAAEDKRLVAPEAYAALPFGPAVHGNHEWRLRTYDLALVERTLGTRSALRVLDISAWNGWLSHRLARAGHHVTAVDYFVDEYDGLRAHKFYPANVHWQSIQLDVGDLSVLAARYDLVILNRCTQFFTDPAAAVRMAQARVAPGGTLLVTGLQIFHDPAPKAAQVAAYRAALAQHGLDFIHPTRAYLAASDLAPLRATGLRILPYPQLFLANLRARLQPARPWHAYGLWHA